MFNDVPESTKEHCEMDVAIPWRLDPGDLHNGSTVTASVAQPSLSSYEHTLPKAIL